MLKEMTKSDLIAEKRHAKYNVDFYKIHKNGSYKAMMLYKYWLERYSELKQLTNNKMKIKVLKSSLDKGESWESKSKREIEIVITKDKRFIKPNVYLGIYKKVGEKEIIVEDFFLTTEDAIRIGKELIKKAEKIDEKFYK